MSKRCLASPWWPGTFEQGTYGWEHTRMSIAGIRDFYWAAQTLTITGSISSNLFALEFSGELTLDIEPYQLLEYQARTVTAVSGDGNYSIVAIYSFELPLHWDSLDGTFCPTIGLTITPGQNVSGPPPLGTVSIVPLLGVECGTAYLMNSFPAFKRLPLYYLGAGMEDVHAEAIVDGTRWQF